MSDEISKLTMQRIEDFKKIINNKHSSLIDEEKEAIKVLSDHFQEGKFQRFIIDESKKEGISIYLINYNLRGVQRYALITGEKPSFVKATCELTNIYCACKKIDGNAMVLGENTYLMNGFFFVFKDDIMPEEIDPSMAWECYINFITMKLSKEYMIARKAYDQICSVRGKGEMIAEKVSGSVKLILSKELKKRDDEIIDSIKSIIGD